MTAPFTKVMRVVDGRRRSAHRLLVSALIVAGGVASIAFAQAEVRPPTGGYGHAAMGAAQAQGGLGSIKPLSGHELLVVLLEFGLLLLVARILGEIAVRLKLPSVVGELMAGLVLGPTILGSVSNGAFEAFHGKRLLRAVLQPPFIWIRWIQLERGLDGVCTGCSWSWPRTRGLTDGPLSRIRLYFPPGLAEALEDVAPQVGAAAGLVARCRQHRSSWEQGVPESGDREAPRQETFAVGRAVAETGNRELAEQLFALAADIGIP